LLKEFKKVLFIVSVDGYSELNNKVRKHSDWNDILKFLVQVSDLRFEFKIHTTIHINNWQGLKDLAAWIEQNQYCWTVNILTYPKHLNITNLENKEELKMMISKINIPDKNYILNHLQEN